MAAKPTKVKPAKAAQKATAKRPSKLQRDLGALRGAWREWRANGMRGTEPVSLTELNRRIGLLNRAIVQLTK